MVDLVPKIVDEQGNPISDEALLEWLKSGGNSLKKIEKRIQENCEYITESVLELFFAKLYSEKNMYSVILLINKVDLVDKLVSNGYITLSDYSDVEGYAEYKFDSMIKNLKRACLELEIEDFSVHTICAKSADDLRPIFSELFKKGAKYV